MYKGEVAYIEEALDLPSRCGLDPSAFRQYLNIILVFPFGHLWQRREPTINQPHPDQPISLVDAIYQAADVGR